MPPITVNIVVEGQTDEPVARRLLHAAGFDVGVVYGKLGKLHIDKKLVAYNNAARFAHYFVIRDMNGDEECPSTLARAKLPVPASLMCFRIAVRSIEAWLLADREKLSEFLGVAVARLPHNPDTIPHPKLALIEVARHSRRREIREDMVPASHSTMSVGRGYTSRIGEFANTVWRPTVAAKHSRSLARCLEALKRWK